MFLHKTHNWSFTFRKDASNGTVSNKIDLYFKMWKPFTNTKKNQSCASINETKLKWRLVSLNSLPTFGFLAQRSASLPVWRLSSLLTVSQGCDKIGSDEMHRGVATRWPEVTRSAVQGVWRWWDCLVYYHAGRWWSDAISSWFYWKAHSWIYFFEWFSTLSWLLYRWRHLFSNVNGQLWVWWRKMVMLTDLITGI